MAKEKGKELSEDVKPDVIAKKAPFTVGKSVKSLSTLAGIKKSGDELTADMLTGGKDTLDALVAKKLVDKN